MPDETVEAPTAMTLKPSARLQRFLGRELISDPNLAILEFVKNAYDAGAKNVTVRFSLATTPTTVTIVDNGTGMDEAGFRFNWLRPGFSQKSVEYRGDAPPTVNPATKVAAGRKPAGEKGLGRLAAGRLGEVLVVWTRMAPDAPWLRVEFDWSRFDDMYQPMDAISIPFEYQEKAPNGAPKTGTMIQIIGLTQSWVGRIPGRPAPGRPRTRLGRLKQDLSFLIRANAAKDKSFKLELESDVVTESSDIGNISSESSRLETAQYIYRFDVQASLSVKDQRWEPTIHREVQRNLDAQRATGRPSIDISDYIDPKQVDASRWPGSFSGYFLYTPPPAGRRAQDIDLAPTGVLLYRDDVLVEPYGLPGNDWLGVEARKASRQGHAAIQPSTFSGEVEITRLKNPALLDMSNRLGLLDDEFSEEFVRLVRREFANFEELIYQEVLVEGNWLGKSEERAAKQAGLAEEVAQLRLKALAHRAGQPLQAIGFDVVGLELMASDERIPIDLRARLKAYIEKLEANVNRLARIVEELSSPPRLETSEFDLMEVANDVASELEWLAAQSRVQLLVDGSAPRAAFASRDLTFEVLHELVTNAIEVPRTGDETGVVQVAIDGSRTEYISVLVVDDGIGFGPQSGKVTSLALIESTKGRPAEGLVNAENSATAMRGSMLVRETSVDGTTVEFRVPTGARPVPTS